MNDIPYAGIIRIRFKGPGQRPISAGISQHPCANKARTDSSTGADKLSRPDERDKINANCEVPEEKCLFLQRNPRCPRWTA